MSTSVYGVLIFSLLSLELLRVLAHGTKTEYTLKEENRRSLSKEDGPLQELTKKLDNLMGRGKWDEAEEFLSAVRTRALEQHNDSMLLSVENEQMGFYRMHGERDKFLATRDNVFSLLDKVRIDRKNRGTILINAATGLVAFGRAEEALPLYRETETLFKAVLPANDVLFAALYNNMASACLALGDPSGAEKLMLRALSILQTLPHHPDVGTTLVNLAQMYAARGESTKADDCLQKAVECFDDPEILWNGYYAHTLQKCAGAFMILGYDSYAAELRERAELIYEGT